MQSHIDCICLTFLHCASQCLLNELWSAQAKSHGLHSFDFSPVWVFKCVFKWPACSLRGYKVTLVAFVWFFSTVRFQMFTERAWVSAGKVTQDAFFCVRYQMVLKMPVCESHKAARQLLLLLQGKGNHLQNGVLLHLLHLVALHYHVTPVWRSTWSGSALCVFKCLFKVFE